MSIVSRILDRLGFPEAFRGGAGAGAGAAGGDHWRAEQAVIDLLELAMLIDGSSAETERAAIRQYLDGRDWPTGQNPYGYADTASSRVRSALASEGELEALLRSIVERLPADADRTEAVAAVAALAEVDGVVEIAEAALLAGLRRRFEG